MDEIAHCMQAKIKWARLFYLTRWLCVLSLLTWQTTKCMFMLSIGLSNYNSCFLKGLTPASFIVYFRSFQTTIITIFTTNICEKCPSSIWCGDSNPRPLEHESAPTTTSCSSLCCCSCSCLARLGIRKDGRKLAWDFNQLRVLEKSGA